MIRQAHTYLVGALSGATLIGIAIAVFVVLVSAQVFHELPIVNVSSPDQKAAAVSPAKALPAGAGTTTAATGGANDQSARPRGADGAATAALPTGGKAGDHRSSAGTATEATGPATAVESSPAASGDGTQPSGGSLGSHSSQPTSNSPSPSPSSSTERGSTPGTSSGSSGSSGSTGSSGTSTGSSDSGKGSSGSTGSPVTATAKQPPSQTVEETVTGTVGTVNEATGGTLEKTGVTEVTEKAVESVAGPESVGGKTVDGATETVNGLLGSH